MYQIVGMEIEGMDRAIAWLEEMSHIKADILFLYEHANEEIRNQFLAMMNVSVCIKSDIAWWRDRHKDILIDEIQNNMDKAECILADEIKKDAFRTEYMRYLLSNRNHTGKEIWNHMLDFLEDSIQYDIVIQTNYRRVMAEYVDTMDMVPTWYSDLPYINDFKAISEKNKKSEQSLVTFAYIDKTFVLYMDGKKDCRQKVKKEFDLSEAAFSDTIMGYITNEEIVIYKGYLREAVPLNELPVHMIDDISEIIELYNMDHTPITVYNGLVDEEPKEPVGVLHNSNFIF